MNSDNLKEQIEQVLKDYSTAYYLYSEENGAKPDISHYSYKLLQLFQDYAMGCVPPEQPTDFEKIGKEIHNGYVPDTNDIATIEELRINQGYNQARQDILDNLKGIDNT